MAAANWTISTNYKDSGSDKVTYEEKNDNTAVPDAGDTETGNTDTGNADAGSTGTDINDTGKAVDAGIPAAIETKLTADDKGETKLEKDGKLGIIRSENIATADSNVNVALKGNISVSKVSIKNGGPTISNPASI